MKDTEKYMNPFNDVAFKRIFGQEANKSLLISFLNSLLGDEIHIEDVQYLNKEFTPDDDNSRATVYDLLCKLDSGELCLVEMQNYKQPYFIDRTVLYVAQNIIRESQKGGRWNYKMMKIYCIAFMTRKDDNLDDGEVRIDAKLCSLKSGKIISELQHYVFLQLPCFNKKVDECTDFLAHLQKSVDSLAEYH